MVQEQKITDAELDAKEQAQFEKEYEQWCLEKEYEQWCLEMEMARFGYAVLDNSEIRNSANQKN